ncbi:hypothetical protein HY413_00975 [Candidatus Kaiserbacteria bacterium]|nr:hypothetical protein [Candidatus Kaiserbacteria bacterium]
MNTKIIFNTDKHLKAAAQKKARKQGLTLSAVLNLATRAYVDNDMTVDIIARDLAEARASKSIPAEEIYRKYGFKP